MVMSQACWVGASLVDSSGQVVREGNQPSRQYLNDENSFSGSVSIQSLLSEMLTYVDVQQLNGSNILEQTKGHSLSLVMSSYTSIPCLSRAPHSEDICRIHSQKENHFDELAQSIGPSNANEVVPST